ncbi:MAG TPA: DNA polymerase III subunit gamma/tau [Solirubrobacteraceae bacterium]|nr:DNA polymerase III subunit gamma/tau [Solirubrobacteraceae bacterium]
MSQPRSEARQEQQQQSLYRRNRPRTFADVVGQEAVVRTLRNAVEREKVHHAYLFVGSRGTGKTSMAKILAACLNCERGGLAGGPGRPTTEPCGECESCRAIAQARSLDVIEMDAASNNSVEDIRELRESVAFAPVSGRHKVYILDEAHMLSQAAWNAFLKTLEEPPPHTVFVLATTEAQKVPATVVDRCHRFDFQRPTVEQIAGVVHRAAQAESIAIPPEAVAALARAATGSFRDALGTLEQLLTYSGPEIALEDVLAVLGATDAELLEETIDAIEAGDARGALQAVARCAESGRDAGAFTADLEVRARELLVVGTLGALPEELALTPEADARLSAQAQRVAPATVVRLLEQLGSALEAVRAGAEPRTQLELALVKACRPEIDGSLGALLSRIERLEGRLEKNQGGGPPGAAHDAFAAPSPRPTPTHQVADVPVSSTAEQPPAQAPPPAGGDSAAVEQPPAQAPPPTGEPKDFAGPTARTPPPADAEPVPPAGSDSAAVEAPSAEASPGADGEPSAQATPGDVEDLGALWPAVVGLVGEQNKLLSAVLADARPVGMDDGELTVAFATTASFLKKKAEDPAHRTMVTEALRQLTGDRRLRISYELREQLPPPAEGEAGGAPSTEEEWVARFMEELDAEELVAAGETIGESE